MAQKYAANQVHAFPNGAIGWRPGGPMDCLGPYAKVQNCPIEGTTLRLTAYATGYADTFFSVPAETRHRGKRIVGFFSHDANGGVVFHPMDAYKPLLGIAPAPEPEPFCDACRQHKPCSCDQMEEPYTGDIMVVCNKCSHEWELDVNNPKCPGCGAVECFSEWNEEGEL